MFQISEIAIASTGQKKQNMPRLEADTLYFVNIVGELGIIRLSRRTNLPIMGDDGGYNLFSAMNITIKAGAADIVPTGMIVSSFFLNIKHYI